MLIEVIVWAAINDLIKVASIWVNKQQTVFTHLVTKKQETRLLTQKCKYSRNIVFNFAIVLFFILL